LDIEPMRSDGKRLLSAVLTSLEADSAR
jgi:hypothetical protein